MTKTKKTFLIAWLIFSAFSGQAKVELPPVLTGVKEQSRYISYLQEHIPWIFQEGTDYDRDLFDLISMQSEIIAALEKNPALQTSLTEREGLLEVRAEFFENVAKGEKQIDSVDVTLQIITLASAPIERRIAHLDQQLAQLASLNIRGALTGLIKILPPKDQQVVFRLSPAEQVRKLKELYKAYGLSEHVPAKLNGSVLGLPQNQVTEERVFSIIENGLQLELDTFVLLTSVGMTLLDLEVAPGSVNTVFANLDWLSDLKVEGYNTKKLKGIYSSLSRPFVTTVAGDLEKQSVGHVFIREVPPHLGMFRGFAGGDCATSFSGPFSFAEKEHTFFIYDSNEQLRGYAQGTRVKFNSKGEYLYL
ncbi:MAG: hypothetical protein AAF202_09590, partial [Pseudomonadota bacterium]